MSNKKSLPYTLQYVSGVCIGVGKHTDTNGYVIMICNSILPETDAQYAKEKKEIIANVQVIADAFNAIHLKEVEKKMMEPF